MRREPESMQATYQNERVGAQRGKPLLLGAPSRVRNQIEMGRKPPSNIFNLPSRPKGGDHQSGTPYFGLFLNISISMVERVPPFGDIFILVKHLHGGALFTSNVTLGT